jgi:hypothetical protein
VLQIFCLKHLGHRGHRLCWVGTFLVLTHIIATMILITYLTNGINLLTGLLINCLTNNLPTHIIPGFSLSLTPQTFLFRRVQDKQKVMSYLCCIFSISKYLERKRTSSMLGWLLSMTFTVEEKNHI